MVQIAGKYELVSSENYKEYIMSFGATEEQATKHVARKPTIEVGPVEGDKVTVGALGKSVTFTFNKEIEHTLLVDNPTWSTLTHNGDEFTFKTKFTPDGSASEEKVWKFTDTGIVSTLVANKSKMVQLTGKYEFESCENAKEYLISMGAPEDQAAKHASIKPTIVVGAVEGDKVTVGTPEKQFTFPYNKETEHNFLVDRPAWTTVIPHDDGFTFKTKFTPDGSASEEKVWKFTDSGIVSTSTNHKGVKTVAHYKRV